MDNQKILISILLISSLIFTFISDSYAMALIFMSASGLFGFIEYNMKGRESEFDQLRGEVKQLEAKIDKLSLSRIAGR